MTDSRGTDSGALRGLLALALALAALACTLLLAAGAKPAFAEEGRLSFKPAAPTTTPAQAPTVPTRATVLEVQHLFKVLGYPLGKKALGGFGPRTKGALSYFQRKYGLPITGLPDPKTVALMRSIAASLSDAGASGSQAQAQPKDLVERIFGDHLPLLALAVGLAALLALLALNSRQRPA